MRKAKKETLQGSDDEAEQSVDFMDDVTREIGFMKEIVILLQLAQFNQETSRVISLHYVMADMLERLDRVKALSGRLLNLCRNEEQ